LEGAVGFVEQGVDAGDQPHLQRESAFQSSAVRQRKAYRSEGNEVGKIEIPRSFRRGRGDSGAGESGLDAVQKPRAIKGYVKPARVRSREHVERRSRVTQLVIDLTEGLNEKGKDPVAGGHRGGSLAEKQAGAE